jgi:hypothetical protein
MLVQQFASLFEAASSRLAESHDGDCLPHQRRVEHLKLLVLPGTTAGRSLTEVFLISFHRHVLDAFLLHSG